jgi:hypothetical protein
MNYQDMRMEFMDTKGQRVILRGMSSRAPKVVSKKCMEAIFRHGDVACTIKCLITMQKLSQDHQHYHVDIQELLGKHDKVFDPLPVGRPLDR